jgi:hypothetical protein
MTLNDLIENLNEYREEFGGDAEVRLMTQQNWPLEYGICGVTTGLDMNDATDDEDDDVAEDSTVYIVEGSQIGYGSKRAWEAVE